MTSALATLTPEIETTALYRHILRFGAELCAAWRASEQVAREVAVSPSSMVVAGMGGSAAGGDMLAGLCIAGGATVPVSVARGYDLPAWVQPGALVVACSFSGDTEETNSTVADALSRGLRVMVLAGGGALADLAVREGLPLLRISYDSPPRHGLAWVLGPLLHIASSAGILELDADGLGRAVDDAQSRVPSMSTRARELANELAGHVPVIIGAEFLAPVARRWKNQLNENAKTIAFSDELPEADHNTIVGVEFPVQPRAAFVLLDSPEYHPRNRARVSHTATVLRCFSPSALAVEARTSSPLAQVVELTLLGDLVSLWLAQIHGVDAQAIEQINRVKSLMAGGGHTL
jgi:glucose/mannose-6-phosphate isomerase